VTISRFHVTGMDCAAEELLVRMALSDLDGINRVEVNLERRDVVIDHATSPDAIDSALQPLNLGASHVDDTSEIGPAADLRRERNALIVAFVINAGFFADALDMGADASVYALSLFAVGTAATRKKRLARTSGYLQLGLATIGLVEVVRRLFADNEVPDPTSMIVMSMLALAGNIVVLIMLHRVRSGEVHLEASWIFTANDIKVNGLVIAAAIGVTLTDSGIPDLLAGGIIFLVVANGARRILKISR
jgi:copper chaperone CopZ